MVCCRMYSPRAYARNIMALLARLEKGLGAKCMSHQPSLPRVYHDALCVAAAGTHSDVTAHTHSAAYPSLSALHVCQPARYLAKKKSTGEEVAIKVMNVATNGTGCVVPYPCLEDDEP